MAVVFSLSPIVVILALLIVWKKPADVSGVAGLLAAGLAAVLFFETSPEVVLRSTAAGLIKSFPVSLIVAMSLLQMAFMEKTGALRRIIIFIKTVACENRAVQIMMINVGFGTLMVAVGATPVSLLPPILLAMGYSTFVSIALPAIGYDSLCTYALLGAPIVVFVDIANKFLGPGNEITLSQAGRVFFVFLPVVSTMIGLSMLWIVDKWRGIREGWPPCLLTGAVIGVVSYFTNRVDNLVVLTGILCGAAVILAMAGYLRLDGKKVIDASRLAPEEVEYAKGYSLGKAALPWIFLVAIILALNIPRPIFRALYDKLPLAISGIAANGKIVTRALWNAYTWILVSTLLAAVFLRPTKAQMAATMRTWWKRARRPVLSAAVFFAVGEIMNMSGFDMARQAYAADSMVKSLADFSAGVFHQAYGGVVAFIGLFGGFITGSEASTVAMFANYTMKTARNLNLDLAGLITVTAGLAFGGGLASIISPAKLQNAAASIDKLGEENRVIRTAFVFSFILTAAATVVVLILLA